MRSDKSNCQTFPVKPWSVLSEAHVENVFVMFWYMMGGLVLHWMIKTRLGITSGLEKLQLVLGTVKFRPTSCVNYSPVLVSGEENVERRLWLRPLFYYGE